MSQLGIHIGQVVDNTDPNLKGRVRCLCASLFGKGRISTNWIEGMQPKGYYAIPSIGDKVVIICENNDPRYCHYLGISFSNNTKDGIEQGVPTSSTPASLDSEIIIETPTGTLSINLNELSSKIEVIGDLDITGDLTVSGDIEATGDITSVAGDVIAGTISLKTHTHLYSPGPGTPISTGLPQ